MRNCDPARKKTNWKKGLLIALCVVLLLILLVLIFATVYINHLLDKMNKVDPDQESTMSPSQVIDMMMTDPELVPIDPTTDETFIHIDDITFPTEEPTQPKPSKPEETEPVVKPTEPDVYGDHLVNILLVGQDREEGEGRQRSDSMILVSFNKSTSTITLTSFMRDQYVQIPGYKPNKLNAAYQFGGMKLLSETLRVNFGVKVDGVVEVDFGGFEDLINLLGGVDINMTQAEVDYFSQYPGEEWDVSPGMNHLNGHQALQYARLRTIDSDYRRAERQRKVVTAVILAYKNQPLDQLIGLMDDILPLITTNLSNSQILSYATDLFPMLASANLSTMRIPVDGTFEQGKVEVRKGFTNWFQYNIDFEANKNILMDIFKKQE